MANNGNRGDAQLFAPLMLSANGVQLLGQALGASIELFCTMSAMNKRSLMKNLRGESQVRPTVVGVAWYTEENWGRVKAAATDPERFEETYAEWTAMATKAVADLKGVGVNTVKAFITPHELLSWCILHNKPNNAASRAQFVSETLSLRHAREGGRAAPCGLRPLPADGEAAMAAGAPQGSTPPAAEASPAGRDTSAAARSPRVPH